ncbi:MAG TPA: ADOP family duplicated permease [Vicinamibacterales bacterium]|nr:ADOP family duplicated permease [Vicinamibacterales bacterium]
MLQDLRFALRLFLRRPRFAAVAIATIALGIVLSATVFALVDGVLFRPLPYREPNRLVAVYGAVRAEGQFTMSASYQDLVDWRAGSRALQQLEAMVSRGGARVYGADETTLMNSTGVSEGFFDMLGVRARIGRTFTADDFRPSAPPAAVVTYHLWTTALGSDPDVLGKRLTVGAVDYTIVGVLPRAFVFPLSRRFAPDVAVPLIPGAGAHDRTARGLFLFGRLSDGVTTARAQNELDTIALRLKPLYIGRPNVHPGAFDGVSVKDLRGELTRSSKSALGLVFAAAMTVFLISCLNVVALLVAQAEERRIELAVRAAIGASRRALMRQLLVEAALLAGVSAALGWVASITAFGLVVRQLPPWLQLVGEPRLGARAGIFAAILGLITILVAGLPAFRAAVAAPRAALAAGARQGTTTHRGRHLLLATEVALAVVLLAAGSAMLRSWLRLYSQDTGMDAEHLIALRAMPPDLTEAAKRTEFNTVLAGAIRRIPGVASVAFVDMPLLQRSVKGSYFRPPRVVRHPGGMDTDVMVTSDYFATAGMRIVSGRGLEPSDRGRAVVITESLARRYWTGSNPVGITIQYGSGVREIVGVVSDARDVSLEYPVPTLFHVWDDSTAPIATLLVRFTGARGPTMAAIRSAVRAVEVTAAVTMLSTVDDLLTVSVAERNFNTLLFALFAAAALCVSLVGIYGLVSLIVARREREMGIRLALGATARGLKAFVVSATLRWIAAGLTAGLGAALFFADLLKPFVYLVQPNDPWTLVTVATGFFAVAAVTSYVPARRAARVDPVIALRAE